MAKALRELVTSKQNGANPPPATERPTLNKPVLPGVDS